MKHADNWPVARIEQQRERIPPKMLVDGQLLLNIKMTSSTKRSAAWSPAALVDREIVPQVIGEDSRDPASDQKARNAKRRTHRQAEV